MILENLILLDCSMLMMDVSVGMINPFVVC